MGFIVFIADDVCDFYSIEELNMMLNITLLS